MLLVVEMICASGGNLSSGLNIFELLACLCLQLQGFLVVRILSVVSAVCTTAKEKNKNVGFVWTKSDRDFVFIFRQPGNILALGRIHATIIQLCTIGV
jgi:hypothetical protein